jgi:hypothetical protein
MSRNASGRMSVGTPTLQCYATPLLHKLALEAAASIGLSTSGLLRLALVDYISRLGLRDGLAEELRSEVMARKSYRVIQTPDPSSLHAGRPIAAVEG